MHFRRSLKRSRLRAATLSQETVRDGVVSQCAIATSQLRRTTNAPRKASCSIAPVAVAIALLVAPAAATPSLEVNVTHVGYPTLPSGHVYRHGAWTPIVADIALISGTSFDGVVRSGQIDADGDRAFDEVEIHLREGTAESKRLHLYVHANAPFSQGNFWIEALDEEGDAVELVSRGEVSFRATPPVQPDRLPDDDFLIVSLAPESVGRVKDLLESALIPKYRRKIRVSHMNPVNLSEHWVGLEMVDAIVWDRARPDQLTQRQREAVVDWVRHGGILVVGCGDAADALRLTPELHDILPVTLAGSTETTDIAGLRRALLLPDAETVGSERRRARPDKNDPWFNSPLDAPIPVAQATLRPNAVALARNQSTGNVTAARHAVERGIVVYCGFRLADILSADSQSLPFFERTLEIAQEAVDDEQTSTEFMTLFDPVAGAVAFLRKSGKFLLVALLFVVTYVFLATTGTWWALSRRGWQKHAWSAFALVALAATAISAVAVAAAKGIGTRVHQVSIIDGEEGSPFAVGTVLIGVTTAVDTRLDLWLPSDRLSPGEPGPTGCFLRPLPPASGYVDEATTFADPTVYRLSPSSASIEGVRVRSTLKQLEGRWEGSLPGLVRAGISVEQRRITSDSYIANDLGVDLKDCYLIQTAQNIDPDSKADRTGLIYVWDIGEIPAGGSSVNIAERTYGSSSDTFSQQQLAARLGERQKQWSAPLARTWGLGGGGSAGLDADKNALMLATTVGEFDPGVLAGFMSQTLGVKRTWGRDRLRYMDLKRHFRTDQMILIAFADDPGPARLFARTGSDDYESLDPDEDNSWTMYRFRIPVTLVESNPGDDASDES